MRKTYPENDVAKKLYASFRFAENGEMDEDEIVTVLRLYTDDEQSFSSEEHAEGTDGIQN